MAETIAQPKQQQITPAQQFHSAFQKMEQQITMALPAHMPVERFMRVVLTAVNSNPALLTADRISLFESCMKAAQDGLLPDGRDGALVIFNGKLGRKDANGKDMYGDKVQWMPMIGGILKKVRNSGELMSISAYVVYENDKFTYRLGDDEKIEHEPALDEPGAAKLVYAIAHVKGGGIYREVMTLAQVEKVRNVSRAKDNGPWKTWWDEMARKTVLKRLSKRLPTSADLDDLLRRDDDLYDFKGQREEAAPFTPVKSPLKDEVPAIENNESSGGPLTEKDASIIVDKDGDTKKFDAITSGPMFMLDYRFEDPRFDSFEEWQQACRDANLPGAFDAKGNLIDKSDTGTEGGGSGKEEAAGSGPAPAGAEGQPGTQNSPVASSEAAKGAPAKAAVPSKPYSDGETYLDWLDTQFAKATTKGMITDAWGSTRNDRNELCSPEQIDQATARKAAALKKVAGDK